MFRRFAISAIIIVLSLPGCSGKPENTMITDREQIEWLKNADKVTPEQDAEALKESMAPTPK